MVWAVLFVGFSIIMGAHTGPEMYEDFVGDVISFALLLGWAGTLALAVANA